VASNPDIIVGNGTAAASALHDATRTTPVVFVLAADPVGLGYIESLGRPGGNRQLALDGGLMAYGPDTFDAFYRTADYVDRVLRGTRPADLPAQAPTKYTFVVNMTTARKLGLALAPSLLARADEVVE
jgi:ABC-type uncharacterized transport system substrate-binding protein